MPARRAASRSSPVGVDVLAPRRVLQDVRRRPRTSRASAATPVVIRNEPMSNVWPVHSSDVGQVLALDRLAARSTAGSGPMKMLSVPSVTMNGGSRSRVTSTPFMPPAPAVPTTKPDARARPGRAARGWPRWLGHDDRGEDHDRPDRQVDAGGQDDQGLADRQRRRPPRPAGRSATGSPGGRTCGLIRPKTMHRRRRARWPG